MMNPETLAVPIAFIALAAILLWIIIDTKRNWWLKLALIIVVPFFGLTMWRSIEGYRGWPTTEPLPDKFVLLWDEVWEPSPRSGFPGAIFILARMTEKDSKTPRLYKLEYSRKFHEQLEAAKQAARRGVPMVFERRGRSGERGEGRMGNGMRHGDRQREPGFGAETDEFNFYELPPARMPRKD